MQLLAEPQKALPDALEGSRASLRAAALSFFYGLSEQAFGLDLLSTKLGGQDEGTFLMLLSPKRERLEDEVVPRSITFVIDTSGSMKGVKLTQAKLESLKSTKNCADFSDVEELITFKFDSMELQLFRDDIIQETTNTTTDSRYCLSGGSRARGVMSR